MDILHALKMEVDRQELSPLVLDDREASFPVPAFFDEDYLFRLSEQLDRELEDTSEYALYASIHPGVCGYEAAAQKVLALLQAELRHTGQELRMYYQGKIYSLGLSDRHVFVSYIARVWYAPGTLEKDEEDDNAFQELSQVPQDLLFSTADNVHPLLEEDFVWVHFQRCGQVMEVRKGTGSDLTDFISVMSSVGVAFAVGVYGFGAYDRWTLKNPHIPVGVVLRLDTDPMAWSGTEILREGVKMQAYALTGRVPHHGNISKEIVKMSPDIETYRLLALEPTSLSVGSVTEIPPRVAYGIILESREDKNMAVLDTEGPGLASDWSCYFPYEDEWYGGKSHETLYDFLRGAGKHRLYLVKGIGRERGLFDMAGIESRLTYHGDGWRGLLEVNSLITNVWVKERGLHVAQAGAAQVFDKIYKLVLFPNPHPDLSVSAKYIYSRSSAYGQIYDINSSPSTCYSFMRSRMKPSPASRQVLVDIYLPERKVESIPKAECKCVRVPYVFGIDEDVCDCGFITVAEPISSYTEVSSWWKKYAGVQTHLYFTYLMKNFSFLKPAYPLLYQKREEGPEERGRSRDGSHILGPVSVLDYGPEAKRASE